MHKTYKSALTYIQKFIVQIVEVVKNYERIYDFSDTSTSYTNSVYFVDSKGVKSRESTPVVFELRM